MATSNGTILIVEDNPDSRRLFQRALTMDGHKVFVAANGEEALRQLEEQSCPDLILLDLSLPKMDGAEYIKHLRLHPACSKVKVTIVSGWDNLSERAKELGADGYLRKPVDLVSLQREVLRQLTA